MEFIRRADESDLLRVAEIEVFNYRLNFYPIFKNDEFYFSELNVLDKIKEYNNKTDSIFVYDDGTVKGFIMIDGTKIEKLFVEPVLHGNSIGRKLLEFAVNEQKANCLWALEKNERAIAFYKRFGFHLTDEKIPEEDTDEFLVKMKL